MIQSLWLGGPLTCIERVALASYVAQGYDVSLYHYDPVEGAPPGVRLLSAEEILPRSRIFFYSEAAGAGVGSPAGFSNLFRYRLLQQRCDVDLHF